MLSSKLLCLSVIIFNLGANEYHIRRGSRIAQLIIEKCVIPDVLIEDEEDYLATERGSAGFGSTDLKI